MATRKLAETINDETAMLTAKIEEATARLVEAHRAGRHWLAEAYAREISALMSAKAIAGRLEVGRF